MFKKTQKIKKMFSIFLAALMAFTLVLSVADAAFAKTAGDKMPWEKALETLQQSLTGPTAGFISLIAIVAAGAALIFGGDMTGFMRTSVFIVLVIGILVGASKLLGSLYSGASALVPFL